MAGHHGRRLAAALPPGHLLHRWLRVLSITELPESYQLAVGMAALGATLGRSVWIDQLHFRVWPNQSVLLVGPSGVGKDTAIDAAEGLLRAVGRPRILGGRTIELVFEDMLSLGDPAVCFIPAPELSAFVGRKDYQRSMVQDLTNLLTTKAYADVRTKAHPDAIIPQPTVTLAAGSTAEWLHRALPAGSMEGGFLPRFLIVCEEYPARHVPWVKRALTVVERREVAAEQAALVAEMRALRPTGEVWVDRDAAEVYARWYYDRFKMFSKFVLPYANRSRDMVLRLALLSAVGRGSGGLREPDVQFGIEVIRQVAARIDSVLLELTDEARCAKLVLTMLPKAVGWIQAEAGKQYPARVVATALSVLQASKQIVIADGVVKVVGGAK